MAPQAWLGLLTTPRFHTPKHRPCVQPSYSEVMGGEDIVLFHDKDKVRVGGVFRYDVYLETLDVERTLYLRVRNTELAALRAAYLNGPFTLYVDMVPVDYSEYVKTAKGAEPSYENHLKAGSHFSAELHVRRPKQRWQVTISSEILFSRHAEVNFEITIGTTKQASKFHGSRAKRHVSADPSAIEFQVSKLDTAALWQSPLPRPSEPLHVCVLTHGLVSNVTADMLYLKEVLDKTADMSGENLVCKGYTGNVCRTERGVKYLGTRLANWIVDELIPTYRPAKLSFIAHSLGGLTQTYALGYIQAKCPEALEGIELCNFVTLASPFLGISHENPGYVQFALSFGVVGKTGRDLGLSWAPGTRPLLERLPGDPTLTILRRFTHRTVYANAVHDGIVPLRTASLLYLDWKALSKSSAAEDDAHAESHNPLHKRTRSEKGLRENYSEPDENKASHERHEQEKPEKQLQLGNPSDPKNILERKQTGDSASSSSGSSDSPFASFLFGESKEGKIARFQTINNEDSQDTVGEKLPKKTSLIESGMSLLLPPHPNNEYVTDPGSRGDVIFHDRVYYQQDLPERRFKSRISLVKGTKDKVDVAKSEERIARRYHSGTSWRKVLVRLLPEAHNNIIVRRRFSNAYGWPVIHHLAREHFLFPASRDYAAEDLCARTASMDLQPSSDTYDEYQGAYGGMPDESSGTTKDTLWSESDDDQSSEPDKNYDPHAAAMLKIIPQNEVDSQTGHK